MKTTITKIVGFLINSTASIFPNWNGQVAFKLLCKVQRGGVSERGRRFLATSQKKYLKVDGHNAVLHCWGNGPKKVLFLHGWMSNSQRWQPYISQLDTEQYSVYALDAPGHGLATGNHLNVEIYRQALVQTVEQTGPLDTLVCHSLGSLVAAYAFLYNNSLPINKYVIMGSPSGMDAIFTYFQELLGLSAKAIDNLDSVVNSVLRLPHHEINIANFFNFVKKPVLVIHDTADTITPISPIKKAIKQHDLLETFFTSNLKHDLKSEEVYERVIEFIIRKEKLNKIATAV